MKEQIVLRPIHPKNRRFMVDADAYMIKQVSAALQGPIARVLKGAEEQVVQSWEHKPEISAEFTKQATQLKLWVRPKGLHKRYWVFVSFGVDERDITPVKASGLTVRYGYSAKTKQGNIYGAGSGQYAGPIHYNVQKVHWGIKPRYFERQIKKDYEKKIIVLLGGAWEAAIRRSGANV